MLMSFTPWSLASTASRASGGVPLVFRDVRIDGVGRRHLSGRIDHRDLDPGAQPRIKPEGRQPPRRSRQQERLEIEPEDPNRLFFGRLQQTALEFQIEPGQQLDAPGLAHRLDQPVVGGASLMADTEARRDPCATERVGILALSRQQFQAENALIAAPEERQRAMRRHLGDRLAVIEIVRELAAFRFLAFDHTGHQDAALPEIVAQLTRQFGILGEALHQDLSCPFERGGRVGDPSRGIHEVRGADLGDQGRIAEQRIRQRLQPGLAGDQRLGATLLLVGQIEVFKPLLGLGGQDLGVQLGGQLALLLDTLEHRDPAFAQLAQIAEPLLQMTQLDIVETASGLLAIAGDKGHGRALVQQSDGRLHLSRTGGDFLTDGLDHAHHRFPMVRYRLKNRPQMHWHTALTAVANDGVHHGRTGGG